MGQVERPTEGPLLSPDARLAGSVVQLPGTGLRAYWTGTCFFFWGGGAHVCGTAIQRVERVLLTTPCMQLRGTGLRAYWTRRLLVAVMPPQRTARLTRLAAIGGWAGVGTAQRGAVWRRCRPPLADPLARATCARQWHIVESLSSTVWRCHVEGVPASVCC